MSKGKPISWPCSFCGKEKVLGERCVTCGANSNEISEQYRLERIENLETELKALRLAKLKQEVRITFTGPQGSGKTTLLRIVAEAIEKAGHEVIFPGRYCGDSHFIEVRTNLFAGLLAFEEEEEE